MSPGITEIVVIFVVALLVFGPRKLPELGRQLGRAMTEFRRASNEFKWQLEDEMRQLEEAERGGGAKHASEPEMPAIAPPQGAVASSRSGGSGEAVQPSRDEASANGPATSSAEPAELPFPEESKRTDA